MLAHVTARYVVVLPWHLKPCSNFLLSREQDASVLHIAMAMNPCPWEIWKVRRHDRH